MKSTLINHKRNRLNYSEKWYGLLFIMPMVFGYVVFLLAPAIGTFAMSFTNWSLVKELRFIGLDNYRKAFLDDPVFIETIVNTLYFTLTLVPINVVFTLSLAFILKDKFPGVGFFRTALFTPVVTSIIVWAIVWKYIFQTDNGLINVMLRIIGIDGPAWLYNVDLAIPILVFVTICKGFGISMVIFLSALQEIPRMYYEAANIDGTTKWQTFWKITVPLMTPSIFMVILITMIASLKSFAQIYAMTGGGPGTSTYVFVYYIYMQAFRFYEFGYASAIAFILFVIILGLTIIQWTGRKRWVHYEE